MFCYPVAASAGLACEDGVTILQTALRLGIAYYRALLCPASCTTIAYIQSYVFALR